MQSPCVDRSCLSTAPTRLPIQYNNPRERSAPAQAIYEQMKANGTKIIAIDPRMTSTGLIADYYLPIRPGSDTALILSWIHVIIRDDLYDHDFVEKWSVGFDEIKELVKGWTPEKAAELCWVSPHIIEQTARVFASAKQGRFITGQTHEGQAPNGFRACRATAILESICGFMQNGCYFVPLDPNKFEDDYHHELDDTLPWSEQEKQIGSDRFRVIGYQGFNLLGETQLRHYGTKPYSYWCSQGHAPTLWRQIISEQPYPVKAVIIAGANPLSKFSNIKLVLEAFKKLELIVVADFFPNANTAMADYVFPMSDWMERPILDSYMTVGGGALGAGLNAVDPMFERRSDYDFWRGLSIKCGFGEYWPHETLLENHESRMKIMTFEELATGPRIIAEPLEPFSYARINPQTGLPKGFATPSGKAELHSSVLEQLGYDPLTHHTEPNFSPYSTPDYAEEYPLILITGMRVQPFYHSEHRQIRTWRDMHPDPICEINIETGQMLNPPVTDGDWVWVETHLGRVKMKVRTNFAILPGVVSAEHNWWFPEDDPKLPNLYGAFKSNINVVLDDDPDICGEEVGSYTNKNAMCKVYKA
ncbi:MAG: molybdopterin-dependent oxidoreductase [Coriobacteriia bacterium]